MKCNNNNNNNNNNNIIIIIKIKNKSKVFGFQTFKYIEQLLLIKTSYFAIVLVASCCLCIRRLQ